MFGTGTDREQKGEYMAHFFKAIHGAMDTFMKQRPAALILAGVDTEVAAYRRVNEPSHVMEDAIAGSPDGTPPAELHRRAVDIVRKTPSVALQKLLAEFERFRGTDRVAEGAGTVLKAAHQGRVLGLLVREDAHRQGRWDEATTRVRQGKDDLLNLAALATVQQGGQVYSVTEAEAPGLAEAAAYLRF